MSIQIIRTKRRTVSIRATADGLIVRAPLNMTDEQIMEIIRKNQEQIDRMQQRAQEREAQANAVPKLSEAGLAELKKRAAQVFKERAEHFAPLVGVTYSNITIRAQRTRWGSCSSKGNLNFNCLLLLAPAEVLDAIVVHELCHRKHMDHSKAFYREVYRVCPDYDRHRQWLKVHGDELIARLPK